MTILSAIMDVTLGTITDVLPIAGIIFVMAYGMVI